MLTSITTPAPDKPSQTTTLTTDGNGRGTDAFVDSNADNNSWASHTRTDYDTSGRIQEIHGWLGQSRRAGWTSAWFGRTDDHVEDHENASL